MKYNANISFTNRRGYERLRLLAALWGKTMGDAIVKLIAKELHHLGIRFVKDEK